MNENPAAHVQGWSVYVGKQFLGMVYGEYEVALAQAEKEWPRFCKSEFALENHELKCKLEDIEKQIDDNAYWSGELFGMKPLKSYQTSAQLRRKLYSKLRNF